MIRIERRRDPAAAARLIDALPDWFGLDEANTAYVESAGVLDSYLAVDGDEVVGLLLLTRHFEAAADVHLMAVAPSWHRKGVGSLLLDAAEQVLREEGRWLLSVKTLGPSDPDEEYALTRRFYAARGFEPLEELPDLWPGNPCLIMIKILEPKP